MEALQQFWDGLVSQLSYLGKLGINMLPGLQYTVGLFAVTVLLSIPLGLCLALLRNSRIRVVKGLTGFYVWIMRGDSAAPAAVFLLLRIDLYPCGGAVSDDGTLSGCLCDIRPELCGLLL